MQQIGFIGLGIMGKPMASNLVKAGYSVKVYDHKSAPIHALVELGAVAGESLGDTAAFADVIITMLPNSPHVKEAVLGKDGILEAAKPGTVLDAKMPLVLDRNFNPGFKINLHIKDIGNVLDTSHEIGAPLPLTSAVMEMMQAMKVAGSGDEDHCSLVKYYENLAKVEVK